MGGVGPFTYHPDDQGGCRHCGDASYTTDADGPVHPCCALAAAEGARPPSCRSCTAAKRRRSKAKAKAKR